MRMIAVADSLPRWAEAELRWGRGDTGVVRGEGRTSVLVFFSFLSASPKNPPLCLPSSAFPPSLRGGAPASPCLSFSIAGALPSAVAGESSLWG